MLRVAQTMEREQKLKGPRVTEFDRLFQIACQSSVEAVSGMVVFKGLHYAGSWISTASHGPLTFKLADGSPVSLPPGLVWIDVTR